MTPRFWALISASLAMASIACAQTSPKEESLTCPATITVMEQAEPIQGWKEETGSVQRRFERVSIYNGRQGEEEFQLAPDNQKEVGGVVTQTWGLKGYRSMNIFVRCRYADSEIVFLRDIPANFESCTFAFEPNPKGKKLEPRFSCH